MSQPTIKTFEKPDGTIEFATSSCCCPPGAQRPAGTIHTRGFTFWYRVTVTGAERSSEWISCDLGTPLVIGASESCADFVTAMIED